MIKLQLDHFVSNCEMEMLININHMRADTDIGLVSLTYNYVGLFCHFTYFGTLGYLAASSSQPGHHGVSAISNNLHVMIQAVIEFWQSRRIRHHRYLLWVVWLHLVLSQAITGCPPSQAISMIQAVIESRQTRRIRHCRQVAIQLFLETMNRTYSGITYK